MVPLHATVSQEVKGTLVDASRAAGTAAAVLQPAKRRAAVARMLRRVTLITGVWHDGRDPAGRLVSRALPGLPGPNVDIQGHEEIRRTPHGIHDDLRHLRRLTRRHLQHQLVMNLQQQS